jgi:hypothetical protein
MPFFLLFLVYKSMTRPCNANIQDVAHIGSIFNLPHIQCKWIKLETPSGAENSAHTYLMLYATLHAGIASLTTATKSTRTFSMIADVHMSVEVSYYSVGDSVRHMCKPTAAPNITRAMSTVTVTAPVHRAIERGRGTILDCTQLIVFLWRARVTAGRHSLLP